MKSRKILKEVLKKHGIALSSTMRSNQPADKHPEYQGMSFESYGKITMAYLNLPSSVCMEDRRCIESILTKEGFKVNPDYYTGNPRMIEVQVSYFKAFGWDK